MSRPINAPVHWYRNRNHPGSGVLAMLGCSLHTGVLGEIPGDTGRATLYIHCPRYGEGRRVRHRQFQIVRPTAVPLHFVLANAHSQD